MEEPELGSTSMKKFGLFMATLTLALPAVADPVPKTAAAKKSVKEGHVICEMVEQTGSILRERVCRAAEDNNRDAENPQRNLEDIRDQAERDAIRNVPTSLRPNSSK